MTNYSISFGNLEDKFIEITYQIQDIRESILFLQLPSWRPGRYELGNFAQNVFPLSITDEHGNVVSYKKIKKDRWQVECEEVSTLNVKYRYAAVIKNAGGTFKTDSSLVITPVNCLIYAESRIFEGCDVKADVPKGFELVSSLEKGMQAKDYFELAASPLVYSKQLQRNQIKIGDVNFHICFEGNVKINWNKVLTDFTKFIKCQLELFVDFPVEDYYFLNLIFPEKHYHGVEHLNSTLIALGPDENFETTSFYQNLLGISSHELFHFWNICRIRPIEMMPYNYTRENYFDTGYIAEGVTTYYGDYLLGRSGGLTEEESLNELGKTLDRHLKNTGRYNVSVAESSIDLWLDGYKKGVEGRKVSIYAKGATIAWILDLWIIKETSGEKSLDDVMRLMWSNHGKEQLGYTSADYQKCIEKVVEQSVQWYFDELVNGTIEVEKYIKPLLLDFGLELKLGGEASKVFSRFGLDMDKDFVLTDIASSDEHKDFMVGDQVITMNNEKMSYASFQRIFEDEYLILGVKRGERIISRSITKSKFEKKSGWGVVKIKDASEKQTHLYKCWMKP